MQYTFEKIRNENAYQVRLGGEFITYAEEKDPVAVDDKLRMHGWGSREEYFDHVIEERIKGLKL